MKKTIRKIAILLAIIAMAGGLTYAAVLYSGFYDITKVSGYEETVNVKAISCFDYEINPTSAEIGGKSATLYQNAEKLTVDYTGAENGKLYMVYVLKEVDGVAPTAPSSGNIVYVDEKSCEKDNTVKFEIYQSELEADTTYYIFISSSADSGIQAITKVGTYKYYESSETADPVEVKVSLIRSAINSAADSSNSNYDINGDGYINEADIEVLRADE